MRWNKPLLILKDVGKRTKVCDIYNGVIRSLSRLEPYMSVDKVQECILPEIFSREGPIFVVAYDTDKHEMILTDGIDIRTCTIDKFKVLLKETRSPIHWVEPEITVKSISSKKRNMLADKPNSTKSKYRRHNEVEWVVPEQAITEIAEHKVVKYTRLPNEVVQKVINEFEVLMNKFITLNIGMTGEGLWGRAEKMTSIIEQLNIIEEYPIVIYDYEPLYQALVAFFKRHDMWTIGVTEELKFRHISNYSYDDEVLAIGHSSRSSHILICAVVRLSDQYSNNRIVYNKTSMECSATSMILQGLRKPDGDTSEVGELFLKGDWINLDFINVRVNNKLDISSYLGSTLDLSGLITLNTLFLQITDVSYLKKLILPKDCVVDLSISALGVAPKIYKANGQKVKVQYDNPFGKTISIHEIID